MLPTRARFGARFDESAGLANWLRGLAQVSAELLPRWERAAVAAGPPAGRVGPGGSVPSACPECGDEKLCSCGSGYCPGCCEGPSDDFDADELGLDPEQPYDYPEE